MFGTALGMLCEPRLCKERMLACAKNWRGPGGFAAEPPFDVSASL